MDGFWVMLGLAWLGICLYEGLNNIAKALKYVGEKMK